MNGNPHYLECIGQIGAVADMTMQETIQAEATLALAFEQRTQNLIAAHRLLFEQGLGHYVEAEEQIITRLGLNEDQS